MEQYRRHCGLVLGRVSELQMAVLFQFFLITKNLAKFWYTKNKALSLYFIFLTNFLRLARLYKVRLESGKTSMECLVKLNFIFAIYGKRITIFNEWEKTHVEHRSGRGKGKNIMNQKRGKD